MGKMGIRQVRQGDVSFKTRGRFICLINIQDKRTKGRTYEREN